MSAARSASVLVLCATAAVALAACQTTEQTSTRAKLRADRVLATEQPLRVVRRNPTVAVTGVNLVRGSGGAAVVVSLHNRGMRTLIDLPISVGIAGRNGVTRYLNRAAGLRYFETHVPVLPAAGDATWVFQTATAQGAGAVPFAAVGLPKGDAPPPPRTLPPIVVELLSPAGAGAVRARIVNRSSVDQQGLPVYAVARHAGRITAAASTTIADLSPGAGATTTLRLTGVTRGAVVRVEAPPAFLA